MEIRIENESGSYTVNTEEYNEVSASNSSVTDICNDIIAQESNGICCWDCALSQVDTPEANKIQDAKEYIEWIYGFNFSGCDHVEEDVDA